MQAYFLDIDLLPALPYASPSSTCILLYGRITRETYKALIYRDGEFAHREFSLKEKGYQ